MQNRTGIWPFQGLQKRESRRIACVITRDRAVTLWRPSVLHSLARKRGNFALFLHVISEAQLGEGIREREFGSDEY